MRIVFNDRICDLTEKRMLYASKQPKGISYYCPPPPTAAAIVHRPRSLFSSTPQTSGASAQSSVQRVHKLCAISPKHMQPLAGFVAGCGPKNPRFNKLLVAINFNLFAWVSGAGGLGVVFAQKPVSRGFVGLDVVASLGHGCRDTAPRLWSKSV